MQITINLPLDLEQELLRQAEQSKVPLQTLILQALRQGTSINRVSRELQSQKRTQ